MGNPRRTFMIQRAPHSMTLTTLQQPSHQPNSAQLYLPYEDYSTDPSTLRRKVVPFSDVLWSGLQTQIVSGMMPLVLAYTAVKYHQPSHTISSTP